MNRLYLAIKKKIREKEETFFNNSLGITPKILWQHRNGQRKKFYKASYPKICKYLGICEAVADKLNNDFE